MLLSFLRLQVKSSDVALHVAVEHGLPELHGGPNHVLLHAAVSELSDAGPQFLANRKETRRLQSEKTILVEVGVRVAFGEGYCELTRQKAVTSGRRAAAMPCSSICEQS